MTDLYEQLTAASVNNAPGRPDPPLPHGPVKEAGLLSRGGVDPLRLLPQRQQYVEYLRLLGRPCGNASAGTFPECVASASSSHLTLDATPTYFFSSVAPLLLRELSPLSKVVMMGAWSNTSIDALASKFLTALRTERGAAPILARAAACPPSDVLCAASAWRDFSGLAMMDALEHKLFAGGLYCYALAVWRYHYFRPGRVMLVDSHAYFSRREQVMEQIIRFLYGRPMLPEERTLAATGAVWRKAKVVPSPKHTLSPVLRLEVGALYEEHVTRGLFRMLTDMRSQEGAWVVGFDGEPWTAYPGFAEFNNGNSNSNDVDKGDGDGSDRTARAAPRAFRPVHLRNHPSKTGTGSAAAASASSLSSSLS
ncbi:hypothetical protein PLESTF_001607600 [Pleodorina starrii]|nr:hypothetical protein PLESTF_001607600 [Pleodorina starrii]